MNIGQRVGKLEVIREMPRVRLPSGQVNRVFECRCDCGVIKSIRKVHLSNNRTLSCGCLFKTRKGLSTHPLYKIWQIILIRTSHKNNDIYARNNIKVDECWNVFQSFYDWSMTNGYRKGLQIDRKDSLGNYGPNNCRYVTSKENCNNRSNTFFIMYKGEKQPFTKVLADLNKMDKYATILARIKRGWSVEKALE